MILKTKAVPLYSTATSNTSRIVTWLTAHYGKLSTIIKGEQRRNSMFRGQYDLFSTSELVFYDRSERSVHIAKECTMLTRRQTFRTDWKACAAAGYISALFAKTTPRHAHEPGRFDVFEEMLTHCETYGQSREFIAWFDLQFAQLQGQDIYLDDRAIQSGKTASRFSAEHGGIIDPGYAREHRIPATPIANESLKLLRFWQQTNSPKNALLEDTNQNHLIQIERVLEKFVSWQFDLPPHVRKKAIETISANVA